MKIAMRILSDAITVVAVIVDLYMNYHHRTPFLFYGMAMFVAGGASLSAFIISR